MYVTSEQITVITTREFSNDFIDALNDVFAKYAISSKLRICHFLAQILHETGGFRWRSELWGDVPYSLDVAGRVWNSKGLNAYADVNDILRITKRISGGYIGVDDRTTWFEKCSTVII
jgi:predicted chitinase